MILHGVMCRGDVTTQSWYLGDDPNLPLIAPPGQPNLCVNWDSVEAWVEARQLESVAGIQEPAIGPDGTLMSQIDVLTHSIPH
jgi:hypothetical protein